MSANRLKSANPRILTGDEDILAKLEGTTVKVNLFVFVERFGSSPPFCLAHG